MSCTAVLFDLDGTLLDTARDLGLAMNYLLQQRQSRIIPYSQYRNWASDGAIFMLQQGAEQEIETSDLPQLYEDFITYYHKNIAVDTILFPGIEELLNKLNQQNIPWGIVTNKPIVLTQKLLAYFPIFEHCRVVVGGDSLKTKKPSPEPILFALTQLELPPTSSIFYVGDAQRDIISGNAAGLTSIIAAYGYIPPSTNLQTWNAHHQADTVLELDKILFMKNKNFL